MEKRFPPVPMTTDASNSGWGANLGSRSANDWLSAEESRLHINHLVLLAVLKAIHCFTRHQENEDYCSPPRQRHITVLLKQRLRDKVHCSEQIDSGYSEVLPESLHNFNPALTSRVANLRADALLMGQVLREWFLNPSVVEHIFKKFRWPHGDSFASRGSAFLPIYVSLGKRDRKSAGFNALDQDWNFRRTCMFPLHLSWFL